MLVAAHPLKLDVLAGVHYGGQVGGSVAVNGLSVDQWRAKHGTAVYVMQAVRSLGAHRGQWQRCAGSAAGHPCSTRVASKLQAGQPTTAAVSAVAPCIHPPGVFD